MSFSDSSEGLAVEEFMCKWFKGQTCNHTYVDFQTKNSYYEVKSCNLINKNGRSTQFGRFFIRTYNHEDLMKYSQQENKIPKYIFVIRYRKQLTWKIVLAKDLKIKKDKEYFYIRIKDIFGD